MKIEYGNQETGAGTRTLKRINGMNPRDPIPYYRKTCCLHLFTEQPAAIRRGLFGYQYKQAVLTMTVTMETLS
jgi:hypothetical protein